MQIAEPTRHVEYVAREHWGSLPVQPPAGVWQARLAPVSRLAVLALVAVLVLGVCALLHAVAWAALWFALIPFVVLVAAVGALAALACRPYTAERTHGYTTWEHSED